MKIEDVLPLLREVIGKPIEVAQATLLKDKHDYYVWAVDLSTPSLRLVVKLGGPDAEYTCAFERTAAVHRRVREQTRLEVPEVLAADESYRKWPWRYFIKTFVPGSEWAGVEKQEPAISLNPARAQLGSAVAEMHQIAFADGDLIVSTTEPAGCQSTAAAAFARSGRAGTSTVPGLRHPPGNSQQRAA